MVEGYRTSQNNNVKMKVIQADTGIQVQVYRIDDYRPLQDNMKCIIWIPM